MRLSVWDLIGVIAYTLTYALFESLAVLIILVFVSVLLPAKLFRDKFVAVSTSIVFLTVAWFILAHYNDQIIRLWGIRQFAIWAVIFGLTILLAIVVVHRFGALERVINSIAQRLSVLSSLYIFLGVVSLIVVVIRNI